MNISLTEELERFIAEQVESGRYGSTSEFVRECIRLRMWQEEQQRARLAAVRAGRARPGFEPEPASPGIGGQTELPSPDDPETVLESIPSARERIRRTARKHGARSIHLVGSVARGEAASDSDVDFLVAMEADRTLLDRARLCVELEELLGRTVDVVNEAALPADVRDRMREDAVPL